MFILHRAYDASRRIFFFLALFLYAFCSLAKASDPEEKKEEPQSKEESAPSSLAPWIPVETKIHELHSRVKSKEANILKLIEGKKQLPNNSPQLKAIAKELVKEHKDLQSLVDQYHQQVSILKYRFPERNAKTKRVYDRLKVKSVDEMEAGAGIDGKLSRNLNRMRKQFSTNSESREPAAVVEEPIAKPLPKKNPEKSIEEADSVILQK